MFLEAHAGDPRFVFLPHTQSKFGHTCAMTSSVKEILSYTLRREGEDDIYFEYSTESHFGEHQISACTEPRIGKILKWAYIAWAKKEMSTARALHSL